MDTEVTCRRVSTDCNFTQSCTMWDLQQVQQVAEVHLHGKRRQVTFEQLTALLEFLKEHQELAKGLARGRRGKFHTLKLWNLCAKTMNAVKDGAVKDGKGWSKYWCDWKYRVRRRALELKAAKDQNRPAPDGIVPLSAMEDTILSLIGVNAVDGVVIKSDPLADVDTEEEPDNNDNNDDVTAIQDYGTRLRPSRGRKRRRSFKDHVSDLDDQDGPSSPVERKPRASAENDEIDDSDDEEASQFLKLEKEKLEYSKRSLDSLQMIASEITRLADNMGHIRDILANKRINL